jgi:hypothetical protein
MIPFIIPDGYSEDIIYTGSLGVAVVNSGFDDVATVISWAPIQVSRVESMYTKHNSFFRKPGQAIVLEAGNHGARFSDPVFDANLGYGIRVTNRSGEQKDIKIGSYSAAPMCSLSESS